MRNIGLKGCFNGFSSCVSRRRIVAATLRDGNMNIIRREFLRGGAAALAVSTASDIWAQTYPVRPVRIIVPYPPNGPPAIVAHIVADRLTESLRQKFVVENLTGAGGNTGMAAAAKAPPDGYTLLMVSTGFFVNPTLYGRLPYDPIKDFAPVTLTSATPNVLTVNPSVPAHNVQQLISLIKAKPGKYSYAHSGTGATPHLAGELFKQRFMLDLAGVPFDGAAPALASTIAGRTPIAWTAIGGALSHIKDGKLRALAVTSAKRIPALPDVGTMTEAGAPDLETETLNGVVAPAGTPKDIVDRLQREIAKVLAHPDVRQQLAALGFEPVGNTPTECGVRIAKEIARWRNVIRDANIRLN
jgi:tripartite-type tricarboxylate transporter receptor subunit TctC